jgi:putative colanic acid biosynthesis acetyltransferase WcaF
MNRYQDLSKFRVPDGFRGRPAWFVQLWWLVQATLFRWSPQLAYPWRAFLLRIFGARVGIQTIIRPTATFTYPWKVAIGDHVWIGDDTVIYSLGEIKIGSHSVLSQQCYICAGDHDYRKLNFEIRNPKIVIGSECWVAAGSFVGPNVTIGDGCIIGARSAVMTSQPPGMLCIGSPCKPRKKRPQGLKF